MSIDPPWNFATAMPSAPDAQRGTFAAPTESLENSSFAVFGAFDVVRVERGTMRVTLAIAPGLAPLSSADVARWIATAVDAITAYYGRPFADRVLVIVLPGEPGSPTRGETLGDGGPAVLVRAARGLMLATLRDDWVVTHELLHVSLPSLGHEHAWLSEGIATYVEPIVRARVGLLTPEVYWRELVEGLPQGLPEAGDLGLERTSTWGRTYWGGALFCFAADVAIRERTRNARSFDDALRGIVASGADVEAHWDIQRFIDEGDRATGTRVLEELYRSMALAPGTIDLGRMWQRLGVSFDAGRGVFDDHAPLATVRHAMTEARSP
jgi:predicted metalloprotease with PDZ domain